MMPGDPIVGGNVLRRAAIESPNYVPDSTGWAINADGSAQFNDVSVVAQPVATATNVFSVENTSGATLMNIDSSGNIYGQTLSGAVDVLAAGASLVSFMAATNASIAAINTQLTGIIASINSMTPPTPPPPPPAAGPSTLSLRPVHTYSYYGAPGNTMNSAQTDGYMLQGEAVPATGDQYSFALYDYATIRSTLSGHTVSKITLTLYCAHSWYNKGMYAVMGYAGFGSFGSVGNLTGAHENVQSWFIGEGQALTTDVTAVLKPVIATSSFTCLLFGPSSSTSGGSGDLYNYGFFNGGPTYGPVLSITYT